MRGKELDYQMCRGQEESVIELFLKRERES